MADWFKEWFASDEYLDLYRHRNSKDAMEIINLILSEIKLKKDPKILDVCCGAGRHSHILAELGFSVTGFDLSKFLIRVAKDTTKQTSRVNYFCCDQRNFALKSKFDLIINIFTSFGYFETDTENFNLFNNIHDILNDSGYFVFDFLNSNFVKNNLVSESISNLNDRKMIERRRIYNDRVEKDIIISSNSETKIYRESVKLYAPDVIMNKLKESGFVLKKIVGNYFGDEFDPEHSPRIVIFSQK